nr:WAT1-related protein At2g37460-like [Tanacetum cinerariifolium]
MYTNAPKETLLPMELKRLTVHFFNFNKLAILVDSGLRCVVNIGSIRSQDKIIGKIITSVGGAMLMTLVKGPILELYWTKGITNSDNVNNGVDLSHSIKGAVMITIGMFSWSCFMVLQAITLKSYPAKLSLTAWICLLGTAERAIVALVMERDNTAVWAIKWDTIILATLYSVNTLISIRFSYMSCININNKSKHKQHANPASLCQK